MERLQGPINPPCCFLGDHLDVQYLNQGFGNIESSRFEGEEGELQFSSPGLEDRMPFLQMLQSVECPSLFSFKEPTFQTLLRLPCPKKPCFPETEILQVQAALELESCVTNDIVDLHSSPLKSETKDFQNPHSSSCLEGAISSEANQEEARKTELSWNEPNSVSSIPWTQPQTISNESQLSKISPPVTRERRKRKRTRTTKNKEEVESQRMTHIAVERNRRRQMNDHLSSLRSLMPPSYVQRGDQASIIGGAIDFVKELEQLLQSLEAQKILRKVEEASAGETGISSNGFLHRDIPRKGGGGGVCGEEEESKVRKKSEAVEIEVTTIQNHVNLKIQCPRLPGQLLRTIVALEELGLSVLHLNVTSSETTVLYSFNLKIEEECGVGSADEVAAAVHQIFRIINSS